MLNEIAAMTLVGLCFLVFLAAVGFAICLLKRFFEELDKDQPIPVKPLTPP